MRNNKKEKTAKALPIKLYSSLVPLHLDADK
jgi:hypothetical protein